MALCAASISHNNTSRIPSSSSNTFYQKKISASPHFSLLSLTPPRPSISRSGFGSHWRRREPCSLHGHVSCSVKAVLLDESKEKLLLPKGDMWSVHKFGGTCVGSSERIQNVAQVIVQDSSEGKLVVVSAMSKVTDMMYDLINKAQARDDSYVSAVDAVFEKHKLTAMDLLDEDDLASFLSGCIMILITQSMLRAIYIGQTALFSCMHLSEVLKWIKFFFLVQLVNCNICFLSNSLFYFISIPVDMRCLSVFFHICFLLLYCSDSYLLSSIAAGHATESFSDFIVGHGELWSAQMLSYVVRKNGLDCEWMDTREVLIVNPSGSNQVDPDFAESEKRLEEWFSRHPSKTIVATGFIASTQQNIRT
uniref:Aspartate/glutamate/uridylate kinase domain-containing protein n=1 Tax=Salix viminalis TaxID=40686 RepID=A0A6N2MA91_SALVM